MQSQCNVCEHGRVNTESPARISSRHTAHSSSFVCVCVCVCVRARARGAAVSTLMYFLENVLCFGISHVPVSLNSNWPLDIGVDSPERAPSKIDSMPTYADVYTSIQYTGTLEHIGRVTRDRLAEHARLRVEN